MKYLPFLRTKKLKFEALAGALVLCGGLVIVAHGAVDQANIHLKLADANEGGARLTMAPAANAAMPFGGENISVQEIVKTPAAYNGMGDDRSDLFGQMFGGALGNGGPSGNGSGRNGNGRFQAPPSAHREGGLGSGVIISPDGYIITNNHVVDSATDVEVTLPDRREFKAKVIGTDPKTDVALIKINADHLPAITVGDSSKLNIGDEVLAIGNPYGVGQTVTMGIVSATGRTDLGIEDYEDFIQTDASINPGNSGGALVNDRGELVGINTAILAGNSAGGNQGIGFAVPVNLARQVMDQIAVHGQVTRGYLGVTIQEVTPAIAKAIGLDGPRGAMVSDVSADSPGAARGIAIGRRHHGVERQARRGQKSASHGYFDDGHEPASEATGVPRWRNTESERGDCGDAGHSGICTRALRPGSSHSALDGVSIENLNPQMAQEAGVAPGTTGVVVTGVDPSSAAASSGLREGDVIQEVNHSKVTNSSDFASALREVERRFVAAGESER